ncbi:hypothetical protein L195_g059851 [Trifolium pratense]|uniref:Uncharacterized protein n=1 Tax=Trifolium pratense TaxID=57577 RepID=A0A2K3K0H0_TRIPR|nr:hypothetical protein L195_g059851 [Trifolium pratense]
MTRKFGFDFCAQAEDAIATMFGTGTGNCDGYHNGNHTNTTTNNAQ